jgi:hypothetical protein
MRVNSQSPNPQLCRINGWDSLVVAVADSLPFVCTTVAWLPPYQIRGDNISRGLCYTSLAFTVALLLFEEHFYLYKIGSDADCI